MKIFPCILLALLSRVTAFAEDTIRFHGRADLIDKQEIPTDTAFRTGVLDNGLTYYVAESKNPEKRAYFRLLVKGGSLVEEENERGIAHYVEHMMFKGTKHFPGIDGVYGFLRRNGMPVGHDSNAFTFHDIVCYVFDAVPTDKAELLDSCLLFFQDIANQDAAISEEAVKGEHNVIAEEWRMRNPKAFQISLRKDIFNHPQYNNRMPLGEMDIIQNCTPELVRNFYKRWYQPQNMAVVAVGDFDADQMEEKINRMFGNIKKGESVVPPLPTFQNTEGPLFRSYKEDNLSLDAIFVDIRIPQQVYQDKMTVGDVKAEWIKEKLTDILKNRVKKLVENSDLVGGTTVLLSHQTFTSAVSTLEMALSVNPGSGKAALEMLFKEIESVRRNGFTKDEFENLDRVKDIYNADTTAIDFSCKMSTSSFVPPFNSSKRIDRLTSRFMENKDAISENSEALVYDHVKFSIPREELQKAFCRLTDGQNMIISGVFPSKTEGLSVEELQEIYNKVKNMPDEELAQKEKEEEKFEKLDIDSVNIDPTPGTVKELKARRHGIREAVLSNGVKVVFWKHKTSDKKINMKWLRPGGSSLFSNEECPYWTMIDYCKRVYLPTGGYSVGGLVQEYEDYLNCWIDSSGNTNNFFKQLYAELTPTGEINTAKFKERLKQLQMMAQNNTNPVNQAAARINTLFSAHPERLLPITPELAATYNVSRFKEVIKEYYSNCNGAVLGIQGDFKIDSIMPYVLKYVASLPSKPEPVRCKEWPSDHFRTTDTTIVEKIQHNTPFCQTGLSYTWNKGYKYSARTQAHNDALWGVMNSLLFENLRVKHSDVYTPSCGVISIIHPFYQMLCRINYSCNPKDRERVARDVNQLMHEMAEGDLITKELIDGYIKQREKGVKPLDDFDKLSLLVQREVYGIAVDKNDLSYLRKVTPKSLKAHLKRMLENGNLHIGYLTTESNEEGQ